MDKGVSSGMIGVIIGAPQLTVAITSPIFGYLVRRDVISLTSAWGEGGGIHWTPHRARLHHMYMLNHAISMCALVVLSLLCPAGPAQPCFYSEGLIE
jgi:hypothetical protein